jgi:hypothetical protein
MLPKENKTGNKYGMIEIMRYADEKSHMRVYWEAKCNCGNLFFISNSNLVQTVKRKKIIFRVAV